MKRSSSKKRNLAVFPTIAIISLSMLAGCELLVDFDRTLIDAGSLDQGDATFDGSEPPFDSSTPDAISTTDASDATVNDSSSTDAGDSAIDDAAADADADM